MRPPPLLKFGFPHAVGGAGLPDGVALVQARNFFFGTLQSRNLSRSAAKMAGARWVHARPEQAQAARLLLTQEQRAAASTIAGARIRSCARTVRSWPTTADRLR